MAKERIPVPESIAAEILFLSDRTCCICNTRGKAVQIHHIDDNPANNNIENLAVLCFDCHNDTLIKGGFARQLNSSQVILYRNNWLGRVRSRKDKADHLASIEVVTGRKFDATDSEYHDEIDDQFDYKTNDDPNLLNEYLKKILIIKQAQLTIAQTKWDTGITAEMNEGNSDLIDFYEEVLVELSTFYPKGHFNNQSPKKYFSELLSSKFHWHRCILEPNGQGTGGTIISTMTGSNIMEDLKQMIVEMVNALTLMHEVEGKIDTRKWRKEWLK